MSDSLPNYPDGHGAANQNGDGTVTNPSFDPAQRLMTASEVAELLRVPRSTVYELARRRRIPFLKVGRRTLFARHTLLAWIAAQTVNPPE